MKPFILTACLILFLNPLLQASGFAWENSSPEAAGFSAAGLNDLTADLESRGSTSLIVIRNGKVVTEWYAEGWDRDRRHYSASLAKSLVGGLSLMLALDDRNIVLDAPACRYIPEWKKDPVKAVITVRQLATHTSGMEDAEITGEELAALREKGLEIKDTHMDLPGWKGQFWRKDPDPFTVSRDHALITATPGTKFQYSNPGMAMLSYAVTAAISGTDTPDLRTLIRKRIMQPLDIREDEWSIGYEKTYPVDGLNLVANWGGGAFTPMAVARIGQMLLQKGSWEGRELITPGSVELATRYAGMPLPERPPENPFMGSGLGWYCNFDGIWPGIPRDAFCGAGAGNQVLMVVPSLDLVVVRNGANLFNPLKGEAFWGGLYTRPLQLLMEALVEPPCPPSPLRAEFAPLDSIKRLAAGSDNWPSTWGDDGEIYTAYGDGWGFAPGTEIKLSLGLARVTGDPDDFTGTNIRSVSGERTGQGAHGPKASGMLMVDGVLYMMARNSGNSTLAWSEDHGKSWEWADWRIETSFGCPSFINYGKNYAGGPAEFVYVISPDTATAYESGDGLVMARVPRDTIPDRNEWEFLSGFDREGNPLWDRDIRLRKPFFSNPGLTYRSSMTWNSGLRKYLLCQVNFGDEPRFRGGFGIYESSNPWGPWKTVFFTREWDTGPGESMNIPARWISPEGNRLFIIFSGDDHFSVRKMELKKR